MFATTARQLFLELKVHHSLDGNANFRYELLCYFKEKEFGGFNQGSVL
jgi:hypothetical protein